jgi:hypothetical protein
MDHHLSVGAGADVDGYEDKYYSGRRANGVYVPRYRNVGKDKRDYIRGFGYQEVQPSGDGAALWQK